MNYLISSQQSLCSLSPSLEYDALTVRREHGVSLQSSSSGGGVTRSKRTSSHYDLRWAGWSLTFNTTDRGHNVSVRVCVCVCVPGTRPAELIRQYLAVHSIIIKSILCSGKLLQTVTWRTPYIQPTPAGSRSIIKHKCSYLWAEKALKNNCSLINNNTNLFLLSF